MPIYELVVVIKKLEQEALKSALKRTANYIFEGDGIIRKIENLGFRDLPYAISTKGKKHRAANFFIFNYDLGVDKRKGLIEKLKLDLDVVRATNFVKAKDPVQFHLGYEKPECTLHIDLMPPPFRPTVIALQEMGKKKKKQYLGDNIDDPEFRIL